MDWEWQIVREQSTKAMNFPGVLPSSPTAYGGRYANDDEEPLTQFTFRAEGVPSSDLGAIRTAYRARKTKWPLTDKLGVSHNGYLTGYDFSNVNGTDRWTVEIEYVEVTTELTS